MINVRFSMEKISNIVEKHFPNASSRAVAIAANHVASVGKTYTTDTGVIVKVAKIKDETFVLMLKPADYDFGRLSAITFYRDTSNAVARRIALGQWA